jgi:hypothetical protein
MKQEDKKLRTDGLYYPHLNNTSLSNIREPGSLSRYSDGLRAGRPGFDSRQGKEFSLLYSVQTGSWTHPASYPMGTGGSLPGVKRPKSEADHSPPSSAEVMSGGAIHPLPHMSS